MRLAETRSARAVRPASERRFTDPAVKSASIVAGMLAGADSIDDLDVLRHGAMNRLLGGVRRLGDGIDSVGTQRDPVEDLPPGGEQRGGAFAEAPKSGQQRVAANGDDIEGVAVGRDLRGGMDADAVFW
ncbi:hypothetical protein [Rhodococcus aetherivorans]|uniref:hypothetical protein n=1 Tax=Rhodococcus aetherivorans TaxID=191292 RepID=UPI00366199BA